MPLRLRVQHVTHYAYQGPVTDSYNDLRLCPVTDQLQRCVDFKLEVEPEIDPLMVSRPVPAKLPSAASKMDPL